MQPYFSIVGSIVLMPQKTCTSLFISIILRFHEISKIVKYIKVLKMLHFVFMKLSTSETHYEIKLQNLQLFSVYSCTVKCFFRTGLVLPKLSGALCRGFVFRHSDWLLAGKALGSH